MPDTHRLKTGCPAEMPGYAPVHPLPSSSGFWPAPPVAAVPASAAAPPFVLLPPAPGWMVLLLTLPLSVFHRSLS